MESTPDRLSNEQLIKEHLRDIMRTEDLDNLTSKKVGRLKEEGKPMGQNLQENAWHV